MRWPLWAGRAIGAVALATSAVTAYSFVRDQGGDVLHALATPFCLEAFALVALARARTWIFAAPFAVAVAINVAHGIAQGSWVLAGVYALPPLAAVGVTHVLLSRQDATDPPVPPVDAAGASDPTPAAAAPVAPARVSSNGRYRKATLDELGGLVDGDMVAEAYAQGGTWVDAARVLSGWVELEVSKDQLDRVRKRLRSE